tara:strand:+ start:1210 stop:1515 length:306 start_codon:yes stop_codon:yes gene_type:complete
MEAKIHKTPWGRIHTGVDEFYFHPKFSLNFLPYAIDGLFIEEPLEVMFKFVPERKTWRLVKIYGEDGDVCVDEKTLKSIRTQGLVRINAAIDYVYGPMVTS